MKAWVFAAGLLVAGLAVPQAADAAGCLKGAAVGGLAGHAVGHGVVGAAAGCAVGRSRANRAERQQSNGNPGVGNGADGSSRASRN